MHDSMAHTANPSEIDDSHGATNVPLLLYTLLVTENFVIGQPLVFFIVKDEYEGEISINLKQCAEVL